MPTPDDDLVAFPTDNLTLESNLHFLILNGSTAWSILTVPQWFVIVHRKELHVTEIPFVSSAAMLTVTISFHAQKTQSFN